MKQENIQKSKLHKVLKLYPLLQAEDTTRRINHVDYHSDNSNLLPIKSVLDDAIAALPMKYRILILLLFVQDVKSENNAMTELQIKYLKKHFNIEPVGTVWTDETARKEIIKHLQATDFDPKK